MTKGPLCEMTVDEATALHAERDRKTVYFCSDHYRQWFLSTHGEAEPEEKSDLHGIAKAIRLRRATMWNIRENLFFTFVYNAVGIPVAAGVLYPFFGLLLSPITAGAAMSLSFVSVISNALRLRGASL